MATRQIAVVEHPLRAGFAWGILTVALLAAYDLGIEHDAINLPRLAGHLAFLAVASPTWGYLTRWAILRRQRNAR
jgi:hypothetical protein